MAERARAVGGTFEAGADATGGWLVTAWLPVLAPAVPRPRDDVADESAAGRPLRVVLVDDQQLVRAGIAFILSTEPGIDVASEAANGELGLVAVADHRPDVVLMDVRMPVLDGLAATQRIRDADGPPVLVLTTFDDDDVLWGAVEAGAAGFLLKDTSADDIIRAIRTVADGGSWIDPRVTPRLLAGAARRAAGDAVWPRCSTRCRSASSRC